MKAKCEADQIIVLCKTDFCFHFAANCILTTPFYQFFLQLQQTAVSLSEQMVLGGLGMMEVGRLASLEGSLFDGLLALLDRLKGDMLGRLLEWTMREIIEKAKSYCKER